MRALHPATAGKLFATGLTVGPLVDSLHNQCLLRYNFLPISIAAWPSISSISSISSNLLLPDVATSSSFLEQHTEHYPYIFCSSWTVPPLLGIAYVVLGGVLPRIVEAIVLGADDDDYDYDSTRSSSRQDIDKNPSKTVSILRNKAILAVTTTAIIIKLSEYLATHHHHSTAAAIAVVGEQPQTGVLWLLLAALTQWAVLDGSISALLVATVTSIGGPLSELPFVAHGVWEYLDVAADYFPLQNLPPGNTLLQATLTNDYNSLALSGITGPCYFAVAMDAIALGRWFDATAATATNTPTPIDGANGRIAEESR